MNAHEKDYPRPFGKYRLLAKLAAGGMAEIYLAAQSGLGGFEKLLVIKCILPSLARESRFVDMLLDEARIAARLNHPNVIQVFDVGRIEDQFFIAMEYLSGESLATVTGACRRRQFLMLPELAAGLILQSAEGLHHAHTLTGTDGTPLNIVHRDVSPQNIFVLYDGGVKVVDFGIAKAELSRTKTKTGSIKGKYAYMSPEQVTGKDVDAQTDVFALGIVLWECLTGRRLYKQENEWDTMRQIVNEDAPSPAEYRPDLPEPLVAVTLKALARDKRQRLTTAAEMRASLAKYLKGAPLTADTAAIGQWMQKVFRNRIEDKRRLIDGALSENIETKVELFGDLNQYLSETDLSGQDSPRQPTASLKRRVKSIQVPQAPASRRRWVQVSLVLALLASVGLAATYLLSGWQPDAPAPPALPGRQPPPPETAEPDTAQPNEPAHTARVRPKPEGRSGRKQPHGPRRPRRTRPDPAVEMGGDASRPVPRTRPVVTLGSLEVVCLPWCQIAIDGKPTGKNSPLRDHLLPVGEHQVEVVNPPSGARASRTVVIREGKSSRLQFRLRKD